LIVEAYKMWTAFVLTLVAALPQEDVVCDVVDLVEINHVYDSHGKPIYTQAVFYDWQARDGEYQVRSWRLLKADSEYPQRDFRRGNWAMFFPQGGMLRDVRATTFRESWTQYDLEQAERDRSPKEYRPGLLFERAAR
jgi:hypothetical protein